MDFYYLLLANTNPIVIEKNISELRSSDMTLKKCSVLGFEKVCTFFKRTNKLQEFSRAIVYWQSKIDMKALARSRNTFAMAFDFGGVLFSWEDPIAQNVVDSFCQPLGYNEKERKAVFASIFNTDTEREYDSGRITLEEAVNIYTHTVNHALREIASRRQISNEVVRKIVIKAQEVLQPNVDAFALLYCLKLEGLPTYGMTNLDPYAYKILSRDYNLDKEGGFFDGAFISSREYLAKPEPGAYKRLEQITRKTPQQIIFFDNLGTNIDVAKREGIKAILVDTKKDGINIQNKEEIAVKINEYIKTYSKST